MSVWYDGLEWVLEFAFDDAPLEPLPSWTDVSAWSMDDFTVTCGRQDEWSQIGEGSLSFLLDNSDRTFDPSYEDGPFFGKLFPGVQARLSAVFASTTFPVFRGFVQGWPSSLSGSRPLRSEVSVTVIDLTRRLGNAGLQRSAYEAAVLADGPAHYWPLQEQLTTKSARYADVVADADVALISTTTSNPYPPPESADVGLPYGAGSAVFTADWLQRNERLPSPSLYGVEFWTWLATDGRDLENFIVQAPASGGNANRWRIAGQPDGRLLVIFSSTSAGAGRQGVIDATIPAGLHHVAFWFTGSAVNVYVDAQLVFVAAVSGPVSDSPALVPWGAQFQFGFTATVLNDVRTITPRQRLSHVAVYGPGVEPDWTTHYLAGITAWGHPFGERGGDRIARVLDEVGIPSAFRDLPPGDTVQAAYVPARKNALAYLRDVEVSEDGFVFVARDGKVTLRGRQWQWLGSASSIVTFSDDGAGIPFAELVLDQFTLAAVRNRVSVSFRPSGDGYLAVKDQQSIDDYGESTDMLSASTIDSPTVARGLASSRLSTMKDPRTRITQLTVRPRDGDPAMAFPAILGLDIGSRVEIEVTPANVGDPIVMQFFVQGRTRHVTGGGVWSETLYLMAARELATDAPYLIVGDPVYGVTGAVAGNKIPF